MCLKRGGGIVNKVMTSIFTGLAILFYWKSAELWHVDHGFRQNGMTVTFLGVDLKNNVPVEDIPAYSRAFFVCGSVAVMTAFISLFRRTSHEIESSTDIET